MPKSNLNKYVKDELAAGYSINQIKNALLKQGYSKEEVNSAINSVSSSTNLQAPEGKPDGKTSTNMIWGLSKQTFINCLKFGAIAGAIAGAIQFAGSIISHSLSWFGLLSGIIGGFGKPSIFSLLNESIKTIIERTIYGAGTLLIVVKFPNSFLWRKFKTLFWKLFGFALIIDIILGLLFGGFLVLLAGPISFLIFFGSMILSDYVYAKVAAKKFEGG